MEEGCGAALRPLRGSSMLMALSDLACNDSHRVEGAGRIGMSMAFEASAITEKASPAVDKVHGILWVGPEGLAWLVQSCIFPLSSLPPKEQKHDNDKKCQPKHSPKN